MRRYFLLMLLFFIPLLGFSDDIIIDERKSDIYFANGVLTDEDSAEANLELIRTKIRLEQYGGSIIEMDKELNFDTAYNQTFGFVDEDMGYGALRTFIKTALLFGPSKLAGRVGEIYEKIVSAVGGTAEQIANMAREADLKVQIAKYRESIRSGHGVIVVAHSQGNLFTNETYRKFTIDEGLDGDIYRKNGWLNQYFTRINVASPSSIKEGGDVHIAFHNDPINHLSSLSTTANPNKSYTRNALGEIIDYDGDSVDFHDFVYYMGEKSVSDSGAHGAVSTDVAKTVIMTFLKDEIHAHQTKASQWETNPELESNKGTKEYRITVEHKHGDAILTSKMQDEKVFPFAAYEAKSKIYQVKDTSNLPHYVKASFGGERILSSDDVDEWEAKENQFYKLEGTDPVE